jgi:hypothetical protein
MRATSASPLLVRAALVALALGLVTSCSSSGTPGASPSRSAGAPGTAAATNPPASQPATASCDSSPWSTAPVSISHSVPVPPVPVVTSIRAAAHADCGYDRLVLALNGKMPSYTIRYVNRVIADASGKAISLPGSRFLVITLRPTQAHSDSGAATLPGGVVAPGFPMLLGYTVAGDSEGVVTVAVGLRGSTGIRVGELPGRLYVDFKN